LLYGGKRVCAEDGSISFFGNSLKIFFGGGGGGEITGDASNLSLNETYRSLLHLWESMAFYQIIDNLFCLTILAELNALVVVKKGKIWIFTFNSKKLRLNSLLLLN